jgi:hypothetical protein
VGAAAAAAGAGGGVSLQQQQGLQPLLQEQPSGGTTGSREHHTALNDLEQRLAAMPQLTAMFKDMPLSDSVRHWKWMLARVSDGLGGGPGCAVSAAHVWQPSIGSCSHRNTCNWSWGDIDSNLPAVLTMGVVCVPCCS